MGELRRVPADDRWGGRWGGEERIGGGVCSRAVGWEVCGTEQMYSAVSAAGAADTYKAKAAPDGSTPYTTTAATTATTTATTATTTSTTTSVFRQNIPLFHSTAGF